MRKLTVTQVALVNAVISLAAFLSALLSFRVHDLLLLEGLNFVVAVGPIGCLFFIGILIATFWESNRKNVAALVLGTLCGGLSFFSWLMGKEKIF